MITEIIQDDNVKAVAEQLPDYPFPQNYLDEDERQHKRLFMALKAEDGYCGLAFGHIATGQVETDKTVFWFDDLYIKKEYRTTEATLYFIDAVFNAALSVLNASEIAWPYMLQNDEPDFRQKIVANLPFCKKFCREKKHILNRTEWSLETAKIDAIRKNKRYKPHLAKQNGLNVVEWAKADDFLIEQIREKETVLKQEADYLSPFICSYDGTPVETDKDSSLFLIRENKVLGWIITKRVSDNTAKILRDYMYKSERSTVAWVYFICYALDFISAKYENLSFDIMGGHRSMEAATNRFFKPISKRQCFYTLKLIL